MKQIVLFFLMFLCIFHSKAERYDDKTFVLYQGGPHMTFTGDAPQTTDFRSCNGIIDEFCRTNVYLYEFGSDNTNISMKTASYQVNCEGGLFREWTYWNKCIASTTELYTVEIKERKTYRSTWWEQNGSSTFENSECGATDEVIGKFQVEVVVPVKFVNIDGIRNLCKKVGVVNLRNYLNDKTRGTIYLDNSPLGNTDILDLAKLSAGVHQIYVKHTYDNGVWESGHEFINIIEAPVIDAGENFSLCQNHGIYYLTGKPSGGIWTGTGVSGNTFNTNKLLPDTYNLTYTRTDQYGCKANKTITAIVNGLPEVSNTIPAEFCNKDLPLDLARYSPEKGALKVVWLGQGIDQKIFSPELAGVGTWNITLEVTDTLSHCKNFQTKAVKVKPNPTIYIGGSVIVCENATAVEITGDRPLGGVYSGPGVVKSSGSIYSFDPSTVKPSTYALTYTYTSPEGCSSRIDKIAIVKAKPSLKVLTKDIKFCVEESQYELDNVLPSGGIYTGKYVYENYFNARSAKVGSHMVSYIYNDENNCSDTTDFTVSVVDTVVIDAGPGIEVCVNDEYFRIRGQQPEGGVWSGTGTFGGFFDPKSAGVGTYSLKYVVKYGSRCQGFDTRIVKVKEKPEVSVGYFVVACKNGDPVKLRPGNPAGGNWTGPGVVDDIFHPDKVSVKTLKLNYTYTSPENGCSNTYAMNVAVDDPPYVSAVRNFSTCVNGPGWALNGLPERAIWTGNGMRGTVFNPSIAGPGVHKLMLTLKEGACIGKDSTIVTVHSLPVVDAGEDIKICKNEERVNLLGIPSGGTWTGLGINGNSFSPGDISNEKVTINYSYTDQNKCTGSDSKEITVLPVPAVSILKENKICENYSVVKLQGGNPAGGKWDGKGVISNNFYPALTGPGPHLVYTYTDLNNCSDSASGFINIIEVPEVNAGNDTVICKTSDYIPVSDFKAQPAGGKWTGTSIINNSINPALLEAGKYSIIYAYTDNSTSCFNQDSVTVEIQTGLDKPAISGDTILCIGDNVNLEAASRNEDADTRYYWYKQGENKSFAEGKTIEFLNSKNLTVFAEAITRNKKCSSVKGKINLTNDMPDGTISAIKTTSEKRDYVQFTFSGTGSANKWDFGDGEYSLEKSPSHYYDQTGTFSVKVNVTSPTGCKAEFKKTDFIKVTAEDVIIMVGLDDISFYPHQDVVRINGYPNPVSSIFSFELSDASVCDVIVSDISGRVIHTDKINGGKGMINFSDYPTGNYLLTIQSDKVYKSIKVEKF
jgi:hypothetical protein